VLKSRKMNFSQDVTRVFSGTGRGKENIFKKNAVKTVYYNLFLILL
jgi:hypothetical protein